MTVRQQMETFLNEDVEALQTALESKIGEGFTMNVTSEYVSYEDSEALDATAECSFEGTEFEVNWTYACDDGENIYVDDDVEGLANSFVDRYNDAKDSTVESATRISRSSITAADDDEEDDLTVDDFMDEDEGVSDTLDNIADNIEDIQDSVEDVQEDDVTIDVDNNISDHYIAECDNCHGIFISAVVESDQELEKISGVCPLCQKHSDQYLKWIVKSIE